MKTIHRCSPTPRAAARSPAQFFCASLARIDPLLVLELAK
jgi:hypothetical protein